MLKLLAHNACNGWLNAGIMGLLNFRRGIEIPELNIADMNIIHAKHGRELCGQVAESAGIHETVIGFKQISLLALENAIWLWAWCAFRHMPASRSLSIHG